MHILFIIFFHHNITDHSAAFACLYCAVLLFVCVCKDRNKNKYIRQCTWWHCIVCNASSSSASDAVLLAVVVGDVIKQNKHQNQFIPLISMSIPIGISLCFFILSWCLWDSEWSGDCWWLIRLGNVYVYSVCTYMYASRYDQDGHTICLYVPHNMHHNDMHKNECNIPMHFSCFVGCDAGDSRAKTSK